MKLNVKMFKNHLKIDFKRLKKVPMTSSLKSLEDETYMSDYYWYMQC